MRNPRLYSLTRPYMSDSLPNATTQMDVTIRYPRSIREQEPYVGRNERVDPQAAENRG